jgi:MFS transporter, ACS family, L-galactonate transporter
MDPQPSAFQRRQWTAVVLCTMAIMVNYIDRATVAIANPDIRHEFGLSAAQIGALISVWSLCYAFSQLPMGWLVDRVGPRLLLGFSLLLWSVAQAAGGIVGSFRQLLWARGVLAIGEAPAYPASARVVSDWFHTSERGFPTGFYNMGGTLAPAVAPPLLTALMLGFGWRAMFLAMGLTGILAGVVWFALYRDPASSGLAEQGGQQVRGGGAAETSGVTVRQWARLFRFRTMWGMMFGSFCLSYVIWMYQAWLPGYLELQHHISVARTGFLAAIPWLCGISGSLLAGYVSDLAARRGVGDIASRKAAAVIGLVLLALFTALAARAESTALAIAFISVAMFFAQTAAAGVWMIPAVVAPHNYVASSASIQNFGGYLGATVSPILTGFIVDRTGSFNLGLAIAGAIAVAGAMSYLFAVTAAIGAIDLSDGHSAPIAAE